MRKLKFKDKLSTRITFWLLINIFILIAVLSFLAYNRSYKMITASLGERASEIAVTSTDLIKTSDLKSYQTKADTNKESYKSLLEKLQYIRKISGAKYLYVMSKNEQNQYVYIMDASEEASEIGAVEDNVYEGFDEAYKGNISISDAIDIDEYGATVSAYAPIKDGDNVVGFIGVDYDAASSYKQLIKFKYEIISIGIMLAILAVCFAGALSRYISKPIENIANVAEKISNYDLNVEKLNTKNNGEIEVLANTFNIMVNSICSLIGEIRSSVNIVTSTSESLSKVTEATIESINEVAVTVEGISQASNEQVRHIELGTNKSNELAVSIQKVAHSVNELRGVICKTEVLNRNGSESMNLLMAKSKDSIKANQEAHGIIMEMEKSSSEIGYIIDVITAISAQTNLLALNASIESARAGEYGKGFAVVAEEIRKLATQSTEATDSIRKLIQNMQQNSKKVALSIDTINKIGIEHQDIQQDTHDVFKNLSAEINLLASEINKVSQLNENMMLGKDEFVNIITDILSLSQENSANTEETATLSSNVLTSIAKFNEYVSELENMSKKLFSEVDKFNIG